jgi:Peptidase inhibitor family I36
MTRNTRAVALALLVLCASLAIGTTGASAGQHANGQRPTGIAGANCGASLFCVWADPSFSGCKLSVNQSQPDLGNNTPCGPPFNDKASSAQNREAVAVKLWSGANFTGSFFCVAPGQQFASLGAFDNMASSIQYTSLNHC